MTQMPQLILNQTPIHRDGPPFIIAEIGVNHDGDVTVAERLIEAAAKAGAGAVKFQLFDADLLLAQEAGLVEYQKTSAKSAKDLLRPLQFTAGQMKPLVAKARRMGLATLITPFSPGLVGAAVDCGCDGLKLASPDLVNRPLIEAVVATGLPLVLSSGGASLEEVATTLGWLGPAIARTALLHCVSAYPTPPQLAALGGITALRQEFAQLPIGYSDHTTETITGGLAVCAGACLLEKHFTLDRTRPGPDHKASLEPAQLAEYVTLAQKAYLMRGPLQKLANSGEREVHLQTRQSVVAACDLAAGTILQTTHLTVKRPGTGIPAALLQELVGKKLANAVKAGMMLKWSDVADKAGAEKRS